MSRNCSDTPAIDQTGRQHAIRKPPDNLTARAAYRRELWYSQKVTARENRLAEQFFQRAIDLDPRFASGYVGLAGARMQAAHSFAPRDFAEARNSAEMLARQAVALDPVNAGAYACLAGSLILRGDLEGSRSEADRALALCPNLAISQGKAVPV